MEDFLSDSELRNLVNELRLGMETTKMLQNHMPPSSGAEFLLREILSSFEQSLALLHYSRAIGGGEANPATGRGAVDMSGSPPSLNGSIQGDESDHERKDQGHADQLAGKVDDAKRWTQKIEVMPGTEIGQLHDGYGWRKYGQKHILGAKYPRCYYKCTLRRGQDCLATRQIQRSSVNPNIYEITYMGTHKCNPLISSSVCNTTIPRNVTPQIEENSGISLQPPPHPSKNQQVIDHTQTIIASQHSFVEPFDFPSPSNTNLELNYASLNKSDFFVDYTPISPILSSAMIFNGHGGLFHNLRTTESELDKIVAPRPRFTTSTQESSSRLDSKFC